MQLYGILELIDHDTVVDVKRDKIDELRTVWEHLGIYGGDENIHCKEIEPKGPFGFLTLHAYDIQDVQQSDDELPFPE